MSGTGKPMLVGRAYVTRIMEEEYGRRTTLPEQRVVMYALSRHISPYYNAFEMTKLRHFAPLYRQDDVDDFVRVYCRLQVQKWKEEGRKDKLKRDDA